MTEDVQPLRGGPALKRAIHVARARAGITSDAQLGVRAGVSYDTLMNWFGERTTPRPAELKKVADVLDIRLVELMDAWDGRDPEPPALIDRIAELIAEIRLEVYESRLSRIALEEATSAILRALGAGAPSARAQTGTPDGSAPGARPGTRPG